VVAGAELAGGQRAAALAGGEGVVLVVTIRRDGTARLSPVEPLVLDGDLRLSMMWQSAKARDLLRDPRVLVHSIVTSRDGAEGEFKIRGTARTEDDPGVQRRYADAVTSSLGWSPQPGRFHLFAVDISQVSFISYDTATGNQHVAMWPPGRSAGPPPLEGAIRPASGPGARGAGFTPSWSDTRRRPPTSRGQALWTGR
jgi:Pyridoxamine 5'-phosphate oxidase